MQTIYDAIYLSPHLDDAALSCGGNIFQQTAAGQRVLIVTVMAGSPDLTVDSPYVEALHSRWELAGDAAAQRRAEDEEACRILGAEFLHLGVPDCIYRLDPVTGAPLYLSDDDIFGEVQPSEQSLVLTLAAQLAQLPAAHQWYAPLTVGHHVDHLLVRAAAEQALGAALLYYEDYPYAQKPGYLELTIGTKGAAGGRQSLIRSAQSLSRRRLPPSWRFDHS